MKITEDRIRRLEEIGFEWRTSTIKAAPRVKEVANYSDNHECEKHSDEDSAGHSNDNDDFIAA